MKTWTARAALAACLLVCIRVVAQDADSVVSVSEKIVALIHVRIVDGRGRPAVEDQTVIIRDDRIAAIGDSPGTAIPEDAKKFDLAGKSLLPGFVMLHEHLYFTSRATASAPFHVNEMEYSFPRLYLACGQTTIRTGGCIEPYTDLEIRDRIEHGTAYGPKIYLTAPYIEGPPSIIAQLHPVDGADDASRLVNFWADKGFTSFKLYMHLPRAVAKAAVDAAHQRHLKVTGHIGAMTYREAVELGIDNLEHGFYASTDFVKNKKPDEIPTPMAVQASYDALNVDGEEASALIKLLVEKHVAITSTLPVFETSVPGRPILSARELDTFSALARENYLKTWARINGPNDGRAQATLQKMFGLEKKFFDAGGLLVAGTDPTGYGAVIAGYGGWREIELLVEAGLTPIQAIQVATYNGARFLEIDERTGSIEVGKVADLVVVAGDPTKSITDIRKVETVFKEGVGYDARKLADSVKGFVGVE